jgi:hypothetical protein
VGSLKVITGSLTSRRNKRRAEKKEKRFDTLTVDDEEESRVSFVVRKTFT